MIKLKELYERFEFDKGDEYQVQGKTNSMMEFVKHIKNLPEELGSIQVTNSTLSFTDSSGTTIIERILEGRMQVSPSVTK